MEEKKKQQGGQPAKLSYDELNKVAKELSIQNQKMREYIENMRGALEEQSFNQVSFFISMLFKVMEHPEMYSTDFVKWASDSIESTLKAFSESIGGEESGEEAKK